MIVLPRLRQEDRKRDSAEFASGFPLADPARLPVTGFQDFLQPGEVLRHGSLDPWRREPGSQLEDARRIGGMRVAGLARLELP